MLSSVTGNAPPYQLEEETCLSLNKNSFFQTSSPHISKYLYHLPFSYLIPPANIALSGVPNEASTQGPVERHEEPSSL